MRYPALLASLALAPLLTPAFAEAQPRAATPQPLPKLVIGAPGRCEMSVNNDPRPCSSGLVYVQHANGRILLSVQSGRDVTIGLEADRDSQPRPEEYTLNLVRMHTSVSGRSAAKEVTGSCTISMSTDGQTWHRATCRATDRSNLVTVITFTGDGRTVTASRPGEAAPAPGRKS